MNIYISVDFLLKNWLPQMMKINLGPFQYEPEEELNQASFTPRDSPAIFMAIVTVGKGQENLNISFSSPPASVFTYWIFFSLFIIVTRDW